MFAPKPCGRAMKAEACREGTGHTRRTLRPSPYGCSGTVSWDSLLDRLACCACALSKTGLSSSGGSSPSLQMEHMCVDRSAKGLPFRSHPQFMVVQHALAQHHMLWTKSRQGAQLPPIGVLHSGVSRRVACRHGMQAGLGEGANLGGPNRSSESTFSAAGPSLHPLLSSLPLSSSAHVRNRSHGDSAPDSDAHRMHDAGMRAP